MKGAEIWREIGASHAFISKLQMSATLTAPSAQRPNARRIFSLWSNFPFWPALCVLIQIIYNLHLMGEPRLHPQFGEILACCRETGLQVNLTTNGTLLEHVKGIIITSESVRKTGVSLHSFEANSGGPPLDGYLADGFEAVHAPRAAGIICELRLWNGGGAQALNSAIISWIDQAFDIHVGDIPDGFADRKLGEGLHLVFAPSFEWPSLNAPDSGARSSRCAGAVDMRAAFDREV